jgi:hypothetical protein
MKSKFVVDIVRYVIVGISFHLFKSGFCEHTELCFQ